MAQRKGGVMCAEDGLELLLNVTLEHKVLQENAIACLHRGVGEDVHLSSHIHKKVPLAILKPALFCLYLAFIRLCLMRQSPINKHRHKLHR